MIYLFIILLMSNIVTHTENESIDYFLNPKKLKNLKNTQQELMKKGFKKIYFSTSDNIQLCGLFLDQSKKTTPLGTIIYCAGFYPGTKEGMSSFYTLVANQPYNILLFDARGHNESQGCLLCYKSLRQYGRTEYIDIIAAIHFVNTYNQQHNINSKIFIHGICSGAFNAIRALEQMQQQNDTTLQNINGVIFDSGWLHIQDIVESTVTAELKHRLKNSYFSWLIKPLTNIVNNIYAIILKPFYSYLPNIKQFLQTTKIPIWFVHCIHDPYVPYSPIQQCAQGCQATHCWWINYNTHANYHMHHHKEYQNNLLAFLNQATLHK